MEELKVIRIMEGTRNPFAFDEKVGPLTTEEEKEIAESAKKAFEEMTEFLGDSGVTQEEIDEACSFAKNHQNDTK